MSFPAVAELSSRSPSLSNDVYNGEDYDPYRIDKMPVERQHLHALGMLLTEMSGEGEEEHDEKHGEADDHMCRVQAHKGVERRAEEVGPNGKPIVIDQLVPLDPRTDHEDHTESDRGRPPEPEGPKEASLDRALGQPDRDAARKQTDGVEDGHIKDLLRCGSAEALADIEDIG